MGFHLISKLISSPVYPAATCIQAIDINKFKWPLQPVLWDGLTLNYGPFKNLLFLNTGRVLETFGTVCACVCLSVFTGKIEALKCVKPSGGNAVGTAEKKKQQEPEALCSHQTLWLLWPKIMDWFLTLSPLRSSFFFVFFFFTSNFLLLAASTGSYTTAAAKKTWTNKKVECGWARILL